MALDVSTILQAADQNILRDATISVGGSPSPLMATYDLAALRHLRPDWRVRFTEPDLVLRWDGVDDTRPADIFMLPISNLATAGSPGLSVRLLNDAGMDVALPNPPVVGRSGFPNCYVVDLTELEPSDSVRMSDGLELHISNNATDITLGGALAIYGPKTRLLDRDAKYGYGRTKRTPTIEAVNAHGTEMVVDTGCQIRGCEVELFATDSDGDIVEGWIDGSRGRAKPSLLWIVDFEDAYFGRPLQPFRRTIRSQGVPDTDVIVLPFEELNRGLFL